jgi:DNA-binding GntR family transcriptional regulator
MSTVPSVGGASQAAAAPTRSGPVRRQTVATLTLEAIRERILRGEYAEGTPLRQDAIASELGVSRIPVREALRQLEAEGLVTFVPHSGAVVSTLSLEEIRELFDLRALIEVDLLRRAIDVIEEQDLRRADEILDRYEVALRDGDIGAWGPLNWEFHSTLYLPGKQPLTMGVVQNLHNHCDRYLRMQLALTHGETRANEEHRSILKAVREQDTAHACSQLDAHIRGAGRSLLEFLRDRTDGEQSR